MASACAQDPAARGVLGLGEAGPAPPSVGPRPRLSAAASPCCILKSSEVVLQLCPSLSKFPPAVPDVFAFPSAPGAELATLCGGLLGSPLGLCTGPLAQGERSRVSRRTALRLRTRPAVSPLGRVPPCARQRCVSLWLCASVTRNRSCCGPGGLPGPLHPGPVGAHPGARAAGAGREQGRSVSDPSHMRSPTSGRARGRRQTRSDAGERRLRPPAPQRTARRSLARRGVAVPRPGSARWACVRGPGPGSASGGHAMGHPGGSAGRPAGGDSPGGVTGEARGG